MGKYEKFYFKSFKNNGLFKDNSKILPTDYGVTFESNIRKVIIKIPKYLN